MNIDGFKGVNNSLGHLPGDVLLRSIGELLCETFRTTDIIGRLGGDEFMVFVKAQPAAQCSRRNTRRFRISCGCVNCRSVPCAFPAALVGFWLSGSGRIVSICSGRLTARYTGPNQPGKTGLSCGAARRNSFSRIRVQGQVLQKRALPERKRPKGNLKIRLRKGSWKAQSFQDPFALAVYPQRKTEGRHFPAGLPQTAGVSRGSPIFRSILFVS